ncbi:NADH-quinone oxidoreductase subunit NuoG [Isoalcanivorax beigongshangi]|uniref:NADH-quinone oxidoreductase n=1 Tax=Isoalcanivorax beigongshangi TaxID=3238810 RepID=A0ABV4AJZ7_9GAMM
MATIHIDGKQYEVDGADNLLQACLSLGLDVPYFCWHPALGSVGACRACAVKQFADENDTRGRLVMSCMTPAAQSAWVSIADDEAVAFRKSVVELIMTNHPHDCPVCEEGGHCHLQDMTVMTAHSVRRYRFSKRTHQNQELGPFIGHEMNRCIACYRCVRYYQDYAGGTDLGVYGANSNLYFGRVEDGTLESEFSGNLTEVCPTGVFTDKTHSERYNRKWDMQFAPSICQGCASGCNISPGERYGELRRVENRYNGDVNQYFLCDRGRFGYGYVNRDDRPRQPTLRGGATLGLDQAVHAAVERLRGKTVIGIGSPRASIESNFALQQMVGAENFYYGIAADELRCQQLAVQILRDGALPTPTLREVEQHDAVLVLGEDLTQTAARVALAVRQSVKGAAVDIAAGHRIAEWDAAAVKNVAQHARHPLFIAAPRATRLDDVAAGSFRGDAAAIARLGHAVAHLLDPSAPAVADLDDATRAQAEQIAKALKGAKRPLLISGVSLNSEAVLQAAANIGRALKAAGVDGSALMVQAEANSYGLTLLTADQAAQRDVSLDAALTRSDAQAAVVLENDLFRRLPAARLNPLLEQLSSLVLLDHQMHATSLSADMVLSAASFAEGDGTLVSLEGRAQRFFQVFDPSYYRPQDVIKESWRWLHAIDCMLQGREVDWTQLDQVTRACAASQPLLAAIPDAAPGADLRIKGLRIAREPHRYSGRTSMRANISVHEPRMPQDIDSALAFSMEGYSGTQEPRQLVPFAWAPGWNSPSAWNKFQDEVGGHLKAGDPGVRLTSAPSGALGYFAAPAAEQGAGLAVVRLHHLFGSDENSARATPIQARMEQPYVALSPATAAAAGVQDAAFVQLDVAGERVVLPLRQDDTLAADVVGLPVGFPGVPLLAAQARVTEIKGVRP